MSKLTEITLLKQILEKLECCTEGGGGGGGISPIIPDLALEVTQKEIKDLIEEFKQQNNSSDSDIVNLLSSISNNIVNYSTAQLNTLHDILTKIESSLGNNNAAKESTLLALKNELNSNLTTIIDLLGQDNCCDFDNLETTLSNFYIRNHNDLISVRDLLQNIFDKLPDQATLNNFKEENNSNLQQIVNMLEEDPPIIMGYNSDNLLNFVQYQSGKTVEITYNSDNLMTGLTWS